MPPCCTCSSRLITTSTIKHLACHHIAPGEYSLMLQQQFPVGCCWNMYFCNDTAVRLDEGTDETISKRFTAFKNLSFRSSTSAMKYHLTLQHLLGKCLQGLCHEMNDFLKVLKISVADPGCLSQIPDLDFYPSRIPDLRSRIQNQQQKRGVKKNVLSCSSTSRGSEWQSITPFEWLFA